MLDEYFYCANCFLLFSSVWQTDFHTLTSQAPWPSGPCWFLPTAMGAASQRGWAERSLSDNERSCSLCFSMVLAVTTFGHSSVGQPSVHSPSSQKNFKGVTITQVFGASEASAGSFHLPHCSEQWLYWQYSQPGAIRFLLWHWLIHTEECAQHDVKWKQQGANPTISTAAPILSNKQTKAHSRTRDIHREQKNVLKSSICLLWVVCFFFKIFIFVPFCVFQTITNLRYFENQDTS